MEMSANKASSPFAFQRIIAPLIEELIKPECLVQDLLFAFILGSMQENNFVLLSEGKGTKDITSHILKNRTNTKEATYILNGFPDKEIKLTAVFLNDVLLINATVTDICKESHSFVMSIPKYVAISNLNIPYAISNERKLYAYIKGKVIAPIKSAILSFYKAPSPSLPGLPEEIIQMILLYLDVKDVLSVAETCRKLCSLAYDDKLWLKYYKRDFGDNQRGDEESWYQAYKKACNEIVERTREKERHAQDANIRELIGFPEIIPRTRLEVIL